MWLVNATGYLYFHGEALVNDTNNDHMVDSLTVGQWMGTFNTTTQAVMLTGNPTSVFTGSRAL